MARIDREPKGLIEAAQKGDRRAAGRLLALNEGLVYTIVSRYVWAYGRVPFDDLMQEGRMAFLHAVQKFDPAFGTRLSTYAARWILSEVMRYIQENKSDVRVCASTARRLKASGEGEGLFLLQTGKSLDDDAMVGIRRRLSCSGFDEDGLDAARQDRIFQVALATLGRRDREVVERRFGEEETLDAIGQTFGVSRERVRQIAHRAVGRLIDAVRAEQGLPPAEDEHESIKVNGAVGVARKRAA